MSKKRSLNKIIIGIIILIILFLIFFFGYKFYVSKNISLNLDEKTYYVHHSTTYNLPIATAFDKNDKKLNVIITIYKDGKKVDNIDTNHVGDKYTVYYRTTDGKLSLKKHITIKIILNPDLLKYQITGINSEWTNKDIILTFVPKESNINEYCFDNKCTKTKEFNVTKNGKYETYIIDEYGNESATKEIEVANIDKIKPVIKEVNAYTKNGKIYLGVVATDNASGVKEYSFDNGKTYSITSAIIVTKNTTLKIKVKDAAGNTSEQYLYNYVVGETKTETDTKAPTFTVSKLPDSEWSNTNVTVTVNATDDVSGVKAYSFDDGTTWQVENTKTFENSENIKVKVKDNIGNISAAKELSVKIDKVAPVIANVVSGNTYTSSVTFQVVEDNIDTAILKKNGTTITYTTTINANGTYSLVVTDKAGNSASITFTVNIGSALITGVADGEYYNYNVSPDAADGVTITTATLTKNASAVTSYALGDTLTDEGTYTLYVEASNETSDQVTFTIDKTDPELLSELSSTDDNTILTARDYSLDTVVLSKNDTPNKCFSETAKTEDGVTCTVTDYYNMDIYKMLEYAFAADATAEYTVVAKDKAGNETDYDMNSDIIPIYSIGDLEAIGSNANRTIDGKEYFMSSVASYRLMNDLDYDNTKYNTITAADMVDPDDSIDYYALTWKEVTTTTNTEMIEYLLNNLAVVTVVDSDTSSGEIDHLEVTVDDTTYVNLETQYMDDLFFQPVVFSKVKSGEGYADLEDPIRMVCGKGATTSGELDLCNIETDSTVTIPQFGGISAFGDSLYTVFSETDSLITYAIPAGEDGSVLYFRVNKSDTSLVGVFDADGNDTTSSLFDESTIAMLPNMRFYERTIGVTKYLIYLLIMPETTTTTTTKDNEFMVPKSLVTSDTNYIYFTKDEVQYRIANNQSYNTDFGNYSSYGEALDGIGLIRFSPQYMYSCESGCDADENWISLSSKGASGNIKIILYTKQNWFIDVSYDLPDGGGTIWDNGMYLGYGYGDGDIKPNKFYIDKYKKYMMIEYKNNWYKCDTIENTIYVFNKEGNSWEETDDIRFYIRNYSNSTWMNKFTDLPLSISFDGNGYKISNLTNSSTLAITDGQHEGLFNYLKNSVIKNLTFDNAGLYGFKDVTDVKMGILADFVRSSTIRNIAITNANIYPTNNEMGILIGKAWNSEIVDNTINASIHAGDLTYPSAATKLAGLVSSTINSNIIGNSLDITNYAQGMSGLVYRASAEDEGTEKPNVYNVYLKDNNIKYRNRSKVTFNTIYSELGAGGSYHVNLSNNTLDISNFGSYLDGSAIYFNPITGAVCDASQVKYTALFSVGCMKWYTFGDNDSNTSVNLLMDVNIGYIFQGEWASSTNVSGPTTILTRLKSTTDDWLGVPSRTDSYTVNNGTANYTIDYSGYRARLIQASEIATITGNTSFNENTSNSMFYYETNTATIPSPAVGKYSWLYGTGTKPYYTATAVAGNSYRVWSVGTKSLFLDNLGEEEDTGIRPVITVPKSVLQ